jgi:hypothetical protein
MKFLLGDTPMVLPFYLKGVSTLNMLKCLDRFFRDMSHSTDADTHTHMNTHLL